jgi:hypothetical protein
VKPRNKTIIYQTEAIMRTTNYHVLHNKLHFQLILHSMTAPLEAISLLDERTDLWQLLSYAATWLPIRKVLATCYWFCRVRYWLFRSSLVQSVTVPHYIIPKALYISIPKFFIFLMENSIKLHNKCMSQKVLGPNQMSLSVWEAPPKTAKNS